MDHKIYIKCHNISRYKSPLNYNLFGSPIVLALSVNFLGKYLFLNGKAMFIFETKLVCYFNLL